MAVNTAHGSTYTYGTTINDGTGLKYYYTEIKGSKPIKDPRIGAHFGSQRYKFKSLQILEQETATHGKDVASVDGREWMRTCGKIGGNSDPVYFRYDSHGSSIMLYRNGTGFYEITGYFNDVNFLNYTAANRGIQYYLDGGSANGTDLGTTSSGTPLNARYVDAGSLVNLGLSTSLGIHTIKIKSSTSDDTIIYGIELIAQDTASDARRSEIKIPKQNVVSFGKKFEVGSDDLDNAVHPHYDPFTTMSYGGSGTTASALANLIDTATSLGMDNWKAGGDNFHRPWNGGRVIKWVDSDGTIKTSVTMMPPNAQNIGTTESNPVSNTEVIAGTNGETINFDTTTTANATPLHEVAKTFHVREFGNGSANAGTNAGSYRDASMLSGTKNDIAYTMDDGLTSLICHDVHISSNNFVCYENGDYWYLHFIGTGITFKSGTWGAGTYNIAQNLPYGTHVLKCYRDSDAHPILTIDAIDVQGSSDIGTYGNANEVSFYQPKRPPIPEDCVVLADYMLMADFVPQTGRGVVSISKGVRRVNSSRDIFYNGSSTSFGQASTYAVTEQFGFDAAIQNGPPTFQLPYFGTGNIVHFRGNSGDRATEITYSINGNAVTDANFTGISRLSSSSNGITFDADGTYGQNVGSQVHNIAGVKGGIPLGSNIIKNSTTESSKYLGVDGIDIASPIHTSHHYKSFETPFLKELIGGDRNMEQTYLICSPDGKTWDEVTRDTSYIGTCQLSTNLDSGVSNNTVVPMIWWRGNGSAGAEGKEYFNKDFAIAYDRMICLVAGQYELTAGTIAHGSGTGGDHAIIKVNGIGAAHQTTGGSGYSAVTPVAKINLNRGDYVQIFGKWHGGSSAQYNHVLFTRI